MDGILTDSQDKRKPAKVSNSQSSSLQNDIKNQPIKIPHSEIEKNRRQKMNKRLNDLATCLFKGSNKNKKIDKLSILKMAVQHMKNLKATNSVLNDAFLCQSFINFHELQTLMLNRHNEFLIVIRCDSGKILYASESCTNALGFKPKDLVDQLFYEVIHPSDIKQVKDQLLIHDTNNGNDLVANKTLSSGNRRSFICRFRNNFKTSDDNITNQYRVVQFVGYLNCDLESNLKLDKQKYRNDSQSDSELNQILNNHSSSLIKSDSMDNINDTFQHYLIAYGNVESEQTSRPIEFMTKYDMNGKFIYSESCIYSILGLLPNQLKSESIFNLIFHEDLSIFKDSFQEAILSPNKQITTQIYRILTTHKQCIYVKSVLFCLKNPFSGTVDYIAATNQLIILPDQNSPPKIQAPMTQSREENVNQNLTSPMNKAYQRKCVSFDESKYENQFDPCRLLPHNNNNNNNNNIDSNNNNMIQSKIAFQPTQLNNLTNEKKNEMDFIFNNSLINQSQRYYLSKSDNSLPNIFMNDDEKLGFKNFNSGAQNQIYDSSIKEISSLQLNPEQSQMLYQTEFCNDI